MNGGTAGWAGPCNFATTEPIDGQPPGGLVAAEAAGHGIETPHVRRPRRQPNGGSRPCPSSWPAAACIRRFRCPARWSESAGTRPGSRPGHSIFMSYMSRCGGPPGRKIMMIALCDRPTPLAASARRICGNDRPPIARPPILRKLRRAEPSQKPRCDLPRMVNMPLVAYRTVVPRRSESARHSIYLCRSTEISRTILQQETWSRDTSTPHPRKCTVRVVGYARVAVVAFGALLGGKLRASTPASKEGKTHQSSPMNCSDFLGQTLLLSHYFSSTETGRLSPAGFAQQCSSGEPRPAVPNPADAFAWDCGSQGATIGPEARRRTQRPRSAGSAKPDCSGRKCRSKATRSW